MKALFLFPRFGIGGISRALSFVVEKADEQGINTVCVSMSNEPVMIALPKKTIRLYIPYLENGPKIKLLVNKLIFLLKFRRIIINENPDVIVTFGVDLARIATISSSGLHKRIIASERGNPLLYTQKQLKKYVKAINKCFCMVFQTEAVMSFYAQLIKCNSCVIPNPCMSRTGNMNRLSTTSKKNIITFSRITEEKNIEGIIDAYNLAKAQLHKVGFEVVLKIYGDGVLKDKLKKKVKDEDIEDVYFFPGVSSVLDLEEQVDAYILNSDYDGFPNALIEAMAKGIPCIATDCPPGGVKFITGNGSRAHLVKIRDNEDLANSIIKVITDPIYAAKLSNKGYQIRTILDSNIIGQKWIDLLNNACKHV